MLTNIGNDDDDELDEDDLKERKPMIVSDDENSHSSTNGTANQGIINNENLRTNDVMNTNKSALSNSGNEINLSPSLSSNNGVLSSLPIPSPPKGDPSPGEVRKATSPSSLSEASPVLD